MKPERRFVELRAGEGRTLEGVVVRYGDVGRTRFGRERIEPGAFGDIEGADVVLNMQHERSQPLARTQGGGLVLSDSSEQLVMRATLLETRAASDVLALVRGRVLRGLSVEMYVHRDRQDAGVRVVERARLGGLGVVDRPAYPASAVAARHAAQRQRFRFFQ